jgi:LigD-like primase-polymerase/ATP dependent DNA ligase-like protein
MRKVEMIQKKATLQIGGRDVRLSNLDKVMYPGVGLTKGQVIDYYTRVAPYLLPHLKDRPITMKRFPDGIAGEHFYEKDAPSFTPDWVQTYLIPRTSGKSMINYILINDLATLVWSANMANLEIHPFLAKAPNIDVPTMVVFDLDPGEEANILKSCEVAFETTPADLIRAAKEQSLEGIVAKRKDSIYEPGKRSAAWLKYRINRGQEFVIGGYTPSHPFDALIVGYYEGNKLYYVAKVRNGFVPLVRREVYRKFKGLEIRHLPFRQSSREEENNVGANAGRDEELYLT